MRTFCLKHNYKLLHDKFTTTSNVDTRIRKYHKYKTDIDHPVRDKSMGVYHSSSSKCNRNHVTLDGQKNSIIQGILSIIMIKISRHIDENIYAY